MCSIAENPLSEMTTKISDCGHRIILLTRDCRAQNHFFVDAEKKGRTVPCRRVINGDGIMTMTSFYMRIRAPADNGGASLSLGLEREDLGTIIVDPTMSLQLFGSPKKSKNTQGRDRGGGSGRTAKGRNTKGRNPIQKVSRAAMRR